MNRTALVTGANRGIGKAAVELLAENSHDTILLGSRDLKAGKQVADNLPSNVIAVHLDLSTPETVRHCMSQILQAHPNIDVLVNNAGVLHYGDIESVSESDFLTSMQVNTLAPYALLKAVLPSMKRRGYGRIVNVSSGWGSIDDGLTGPFAYAVSKASLNALTLSVSQGLPRNIKINAMCPGWVRTRMGGMGATRSTAKGAETIVWLVNIDERGPSGQFFRDCKVISW